MGWYQNGHRDETWEAKVGDKNFLWGGGDGVGVGEDALGQEAMGRREFGTWHRARDGARMAG